MTNKINKTSLQKNHWSSTKVFAVITAALTVFPLSVGLITETLAFPTQQHRDIVRRENQLLEKYGSEENALQQDEYQVLVNMPEAKHSKAINNFFYYNIRPIMGLIYVLLFLIGGYFVVVSGTYITVGSFFGFLLMGFASIWLGNNLFFSWVENVFFGIPWRFDWFVLNIFTYTYLVLVALLLLTYSLGRLKAEKKFSNKKKRISKNNSTK